MCSHIMGELCENTEVRTLFGASVLWRVNHDHLVNCIFLFSLLDYSYVKRGVPGQVVNRARIFV